MRQRHSVPWLVAPSAPVVAPRAPLPVTGVEPLSASHVPLPLASVETLPASVGSNFPAAFTLPPVVVDTRIPHPPLMNGVFGAPLVPEPTAVHLPNPEAIVQGEAASEQLVDEQLRHCAEVLDQQLKQRSGYLHAAGDQRKKLFLLQVDQQVKEQDLELTKQYNDQLLMLQQAAHQQKAAVRQQAHALQLQYTQRQTRESLTQQHTMLQQQHLQQQLQNEEELHALQTQRAAAAQHVAMQREMIAQHAAAALQRARQVIGSSHVSPAPTLTASTPSLLVPTSAPYTPPPGVSLVERQASQPPAPQGMQCFRLPKVELDSAALGRFHADPPTLPAGAGAADPCGPSADGAGAEVVHL